MNPSSSILGSGFEGTPLPSQKLLSKDHLNAKVGGGATFHLLCTICSVMQGKNHDFFKDLGDEGNEREDKEQASS